MALDHSCQVQRHTHAERGHDLYTTPDCATETLLRHERLPVRLWEPACGPGCPPAMVAVLRRAGHDVYSSDLVNYGDDPGAHYGVDFLQLKSAPPEYGDAIVTNPPFKLATLFAAKALELVPKVWLLMRLAFLEAGDADSTSLVRRLRSQVLDGGALARIHVFRRRLPMMHRDGWSGRKSNSGMAFAWMCWDADHSGPATVDRVSWDK